MLVAEGSRGSLLGEFVAGGGTTEDGRDHPAVEVEMAGAAVSLVVTSFECEDAGCVGGLAAVKASVNFSINSVRPKDDLPSGAPDFIVEDVELDADPEADEFFSRNLLVMLTVLNFFG